MSLIITRGFGEEDGVIIEYVPVPVDKPEMTAHERGKKSMTVQEIGKKSMRVEPSFVVVVDE